MIPKCSNVEGQNSEPSAVFLQPGAHHFIFSLVAVPPHPPIFKVMPGCDSQGLGLSVKHNFENGAAGGRAQSFVLLPWKMSNIVDNNVLMMIELSSRLCNSGQHVSVGY